MNKHKYYIAVCLCFAILNSCNVPEPNKSEPEVFVYNNMGDTVSNKYLKRIWKLPAYEEWGFKTGGKKGNSRIYTQTLVINGNTFYHVELVRFRHMKDAFSSSAPPPETVCYFRIDPVADKIKILDISKKEFLDIALAEGQEYFKECLLEE